MYKDVKIINRPILDFWLRIPFIEIRTGLMTERLEIVTKEYCYLDVKIYKWDFRFRLYDTLRKINS